MKIIFKTKDLLDKIKNIAPTASKTTLMILGNLVIKVTGNTAQQLHRILK